MIKPVFKHDCDEPRCCKFLTHRKGKDIYIFGENEGILVRYGNEPSDNLTYQFELLMKLGAFDDWIS